MNERPILFNDAMVRAILDGSKTQTRRPLKVQLPDGFDPGRVSLDWLHPSVEPERQSYGFWINDRAAYVSPFGGPGDRLWIRECFCIESNYSIDDANSYPPPFADGRPIRYDSSSDNGPWWEQPYYRATDPRPKLAYPDGEGGPCVRWQPSIHMPRWACRITRSVNRVWIEKLQDITPEDAKAEGFAPIYYGSAISAVEPFVETWDSIYAPKGVGWSENPWVIGCEFERMPR